MATYTPSLGWNHEFVRSLVWVLEAGTISGALLLVVAMLLARYTTWGRQFWRITGDYFKGRQSVRVWGLFVVLLLSIMMNVRIEVLLSYYANDLYSSLQVAFQGTAAHNTAARNSGIHGFWMAIWTSSSTPGSFGARPVKPPERQADRTSFPNNGRGHTRGEAG